MGGAQGGQAGQAGRGGGGGGTAGASGSGGAGGRGGSGGAGGRGGSAGGAGGGGGASGTAGAGGRGGSAGGGAAAGQAAERVQSLPGDRHDCIIMPLGDSITFGVGSSGSGGGYRVPLFQTTITNADAITFVGRNVNGPATVGGRTFPQGHEGYSGYTIDPRRR